MLTRTNTDLANGRCVLNSSTSLLRLLQLSSPQLPTGAYTFSQGLEWAVHAGWIATDDELLRWLQEQLDGSMAHQELPLLSRLFDAFQNDNLSTAHYWCQFALACRETAEFRQEERDRAQALYRVLAALSAKGTELYKSALLLTPLAGMALAATRWSISKQDLLQAYAFAWLENQVMAGIKLIPLGQSTGQGLLFTLAEYIPEIVVRSGTIPDEDVGYTCISVSKAGCLHETQYSKLYRS